MSKKAKTFAVIGLGRFGTSVAQTLCALGHEVLAVDRDENRVAAVADSVTHAMVADTTDERALKRIGIRKHRNHRPSAEAANVKVSVRADFFAKCSAGFLRMFSCQNPVEQRHKHFRLSSVADGAVFMPITLDKALLYAICKR